MDPHLLERFERLTAARTGLQIREKDRTVFQRLLLSQMKALKLTTPEDYYQLLQTNTAEGQLEWRQLIVRLTNRESYFFRDKGQLALLQNRILPELIERNKSQRTLRLWSAGCSTGEEPYTLAILVEQLLPRPSDWKVLILGSDINEDSLDIARRAVYSSWSFRMVDLKIRERYFHAQGDTWKLDRRIRDAVTFRHLNLFADNFPGTSPELRDMDLIICRNVFIYFDTAAVAAVLPKFADALTMGGYLMTGHAELNAHKPGYLHPRAFPESVVYQKSPEEYHDGQRSRAKAALYPKAAPSTPPASKPTVRKPQPVQTVKSAPVPRPAQPEKVESSGLNPLFVEAEALLRSGAYNRVVEKVEQLLSSEPSHHAAVCLVAQAYANLGQHEKAIEYCRTAIALDSFGAEPYRLLAHIMEEQGDVEDAKRLLKKVIYLAPSFVPGYLELAALYQREGDVVRSEKMRDAAISHLKQMPPDSIVDARGELTAREIMQHLEETPVSRTGTLRP